MEIRRLLREGKSIYELPLRVCYYARVSTDHEEQLSSIVNQEVYFIKYIESIGIWNFVDGYVDDGVSGKDVNKRENFMRMIEDGKKLKYDLILTKSVSRFARNTVDSINYTNLLLDLGIGVYFISDNINTFYGDSEFRLTLMASIAQDELRKLSDSVRFGLRQSINRGVVLGNDNILGYRKNRGKLVIIEEEAVIVREIFDLFVSGIHNYSEIARLINLKYKKNLNSTSIKRILTNYKYKGYYCGKKSEVIDYKKNKRRGIGKEDWVIYRDYERVPPIVDEVIWDSVDSVIEKRKNTYRDFYFNKVFCLVHGRVKVKKKKYRDKYYSYYICRDCFRISDSVLDRIVRGMKFSRILVSKRDRDLRIDIFK